MSDPTGSTPREPLSSAVGEPMGSAVGEPTGSAVGEPTGSAVGEPTGSAVGEPTGSAPSGRTGTETAVLTGSSPRRAPRIRTLVFGLVALAVAVTVLVAEIADVRVDGGAVLLAVLVMAGLALLGGGIAAAAKEARGGPGA